MFYGLRKSAALGVLLALGCGAAVAEPIECPATVSAKPWDSVEIYEGHPSEQTPLRPDEGATSEKPVSVWKFEPGKKRIWLVCSYKRITDTMEFELPAGTRKCEVKFKKKVPEAVDCS